MLQNKSIKLSVSLHYSRVRELSWGIVDCVIVLMRRDEGLTDVSAWVVPRSSSISIKRHSCFPLRPRRYRSLSSELLVLIAMWWHGPAGWSKKLTLSVRRKLLVWRVDTVNSLHSLRSGTISTLILRVSWASLLCTLITVFL